MKTQILRLETHDDTASIRDKIAWAKAGRILLAFPKRRPPHLSRLDIILIQRAVAQTGAQLALTTRDAEIIRLARELDIPVFASIQTAQRKPWIVVNRKHRVFSLRRAETPRWTELHAAFKQQPQSPPPKWLHYGMFTLGLVAFLVLILLFVPGAVIEVSPVRELQTIDLTIMPQVGIPAVLPNGQIPAAELHSTVSGQMEAVATGTILVPYTSAQVTLLITNQTSQPVIIPAGTVFVTMEQEIVRFFTRERTTLEGGIGNTVEVQAEAVTPGSEGNVPAGAINGVEGALGLQIYVTNPAPAEGGTDRTGRAASEMDYSQLYDSLITSLTETAVANLEAQYGDDLVIISESMKVERVVEDQRHPAENSPSDRVSLSLTVDIKGLAVSRADLAAAAAPSMDAGIPKDKLVEPGSYEFIRLAAPVILPDGRMFWKIQVSRNLVQNVQYKGLSLAIKGQRIPEAELMIQDNLGIDQVPHIQISPSWWPRLPLIPFRIEVITK